MTAEPFSVVLLAAAAVSAVVAARLTQRALFDDADRLHRVELRR